MNPNPTSIQCPALGRYRALSAITNPTVKNIFEDGMNGSIISEQHIIINLMERERGLMGCLGEYSVYLYIYMFIDYVNYKCLSY